ncbi:MAG: hypothetical protein GY801_52540 [bacterium]|nr:hypothetical protein [bacterium]
MKHQRTLYYQALLFLTSIVLAGAVQMVESTETTIWTTSSFADFQKGEFEGVSLTNSGDLSLAPSTETRLTLEGNDLQVWALAEDSQGSIYAGTGEQGKIFKMTPDGETSLFFDSPEIGILSLAVGPDDALYAGTTPDGLIYKISSDGNADTFFMSGEHYVWSLVFGPNDLLYAGTGESGKIFSIAPDGTGTLFYDSPQSHIMSLLYDARTWLYAGTEGKGIVYKIDSAGKAFALYHAPEEEIHRLALDEAGNLYLAALSSTVFPKAPAPAAKEPQPAQNEKGLKHSTIYRISPQGTVVELLDLAGTLIYTMLAEKNGELLIGTDRQGGLYKVLPNGDYHQLLNLKTGTIVSALKSADNALYIGTGDAGAVYRIASQPSQQGEYLSDIHHAPSVSSWGKIFWQGTPQHISLFSRTGNTALPDDTWSEWSEALLNSDGEVLPNPPARHIQWKAVLTPEEQTAPVLKEVSVAYLPHNLSPKIEEIAIYHAALLNREKKSNGASKKTTTPKPVVQPVTAKKADGSSLKAPKVLPAGHVVILWKAKDPNKEPLLYSISLRGEQEPHWRILEEEQKESRYLLDTGTLADGRYVIQINASDLPNNPPDNALATEKISEPFDVDNSAPTITIALNQQQDDGAILLTIIAQDDYSRLRQAEYAIDAGDWFSIFPDDLVTDSRDEKYSISLSDLDEGLHVLSFKAMDRFGNIGVGKIQFSASETSVQATE